MEHNIWLAHPIESRIRITDMYSLFKIHYDKDYTFAGEIHNFWECVYVLDGQVCVSAEEKVYNMGGGEIIFHKPLELHKFIVNGEAGATLLIFSFSAEGALTEKLRDKVIQLSDNQMGILSGLISYMESRTANMQLPKRERQYLVPFEQIPHFGQMVTTYLHQLFLSIEDEGVVASVSSAPDAITFRNAISFLNCNLQDQPSVAEIARFCAVSEASLKRIFDKYTGISVHKYLLRLKMKVATELLKDGESVNNVAERLGFRSQSYFSKAYKRECGISPSDVT